jgi:hypothetical protein
VWRHGPRTDRCYMALQNPYSFIMTWMTYKYP